MPSDTTPANLAGFKLVTTITFRLCLHTLSDAEDMPGKVATDIRYEKLSTDRSDCRLSFASPVGLLLSCNHIYNQYVIIDNSEENLQKFEKSARNMQ